MQFGIFIPRSEELHLSFTVRINVRLLSTRENQGGKQTKLSTVIYVPSFVCTFPTGEHQRGFPVVVTQGSITVWRPVYQFNIIIIKVRMTSIHYSADHGSGDS